MHGTSITASQQPTESSIDQPKFQLFSQGYKVELPNEFAFIKPMNTVNKKVTAPTKEVQAPYINIDEEFAKEKIWTDVSQVFISYLMTED